MDTTIALWKAEHGADYAVPSILADWLHDASWHNDVCPRFQLMRDGLGYDLWVDHPSRLERWDGGQAGAGEDAGRRYRVCVHEACGLADDPVVATDDLAELLGWLATAEPADLERSPSCPTCGGDVDADGQCQQSCDAVDDDDIDGGSYRA